MSGPGAEDGATPTDTTPHVSGTPEAPDSPEAAAPPSARRGRPTRAQLVAGGVVVALLVGVVAVVLLGLRVRAADAETADRVRVQEVASEVATQMVTLSADNAPVHVETMLALSTDPFRDQLARLSEAFGEILRQGEVATEGRLDAVGVESIGDGEASVLVSAATTVRNTEIPDGAPRTYRLAIGLRQVDGAWLVSSVEVAQ